MDDPLGGLEGDYDSRWVGSDRAGPGMPVWDVDGVPHGDAPCPPRRHRCRPQTKALRAFRLIERCPCGAIRVDGGRWRERNSRPAADRPARRSLWCVLGWHRHRGLSDGRETTYPCTRCGAEPGPCRNCGGQHDPNAFTICSVTR